MASFGKKGLADVVKFRIFRGNNPGLSGWGPDANIRVSFYERGREGNVKMEQREMWPYPKGCQQPPQAGRSKGRRSSRASGGNLAFGLEYLATRTMRESISDVFSHQVCGNWL